MCQALEVSENGDYNWRKKGKSQKKQDDELLTERIEDAYHQTRGHDGSPRIHIELQDQGIHCGQKRVARLMQEHELSARKKKRTPPTTNSHHDFPLAPNLLKQNFSANAPDEKWMPDFTIWRRRKGGFFWLGYWMPTRAK
jgi:putative transposase